MAMTLIWLPLQAAMCLLGTLITSLSKKFVKAKPCSDRRPQSDASREHDAGTRSEISDRKDVADDSVSNCSTEVRASLAEDEHADSWRVELAVSDTVLIFSQTDRKWYDGVVTGVRPDELTIVFCIGLRMMVKDVPLSSPCIQKGPAHDAEP
eukprot:TRINITY_DN35642_c0_g1_i1.p1 TRINITY_DN35642_c0_g1~~TRINITY_DN35642_c0_g1_i1.p1  ORF type:complete len:159 (-),score=21.13 TRINITY_DN35642_c0_g1_i1:128-583(-)